MSELQNLVVRLEAEIASMQSDLRKAEGAVKRYDRQVSSSTAKSSKSFKDHLMSMKTAVSGIIASFTAGAAAVGIFNAAVNANTLADIADASGVTIEFMSTLKTMALQNGLAFGELEGATRDFAVKMGELRTGIGGFNDFVKQHIPELHRMLQATNNQEEALRVMAEAFGRLESQADRAALANQAFGGAGTKLAAIMSGGTAVIDSAAASSRDLAIVLDTETVTATRALQRSYDEMMATMETSTARLAGSLSPVLTWIMDSIGQMVRAFDEAVAHLKNSVNNVVTLFKVLANNVSGMQVFEFQGLKDGGVAAGVAGLTAPPQPGAGGGAGEPAPVSPINKKDPLKVYTKAYNDAMAEVGKANAKVAADFDSSMQQVGNLLTNNLMAPLNDAFAGNMKSMEEYFTSMLTSLASAIAQALVLQSIMGALGVSTGGASGILGAFGGFFAGGGHVTANKPVVVGERGPELFVPQTSGQIQSNSVMNNNSGGNAGGVLRVEGISTSAMFDGATVRALAKKLIEYQRDGGKVVLA